MAGYVVTVEDADGGAKTTIRVDFSGGIPHITELLYSAGAGGSISTNRLPVADMEALVRALAPPVPVPPAAGLGAPTETRAAIPAAIPATAPATEVVPAATVPATEAEPAAPVPVAEAGRARAAARSRGRAGVPAKKARATARRGRPKAKAVPAPEAAVTTTGRQYRRMPNAMELIDAYHEADSVNELVERYQVPRHTMNGWLSRLRREGLLEPRRPRRAAT